MSSESTSLTDAVGGCQPPLTPPLPTPAFGEPTLPAEEPVLPGLLVAITNFVEYNQRVAHESNRAHERLQVRLEELSRQFHDLLREFRLLRSDLVGQLERLSGECVRLRDEREQILQERDEADQRFQRALEELRSRSTTTGGSSQPQHADILRAFQNFKSQLHWATLNLHKAVFGESQYDEREQAAIKAALAEALLGRHRSGDAVAVRERVCCRVVEFFPQACQPDGSLDVDWAELTKSAENIYRDALAADPVGRFDFPDPGTRLDAQRHKWLTGGDDAPGAVIRFAVVPGYEVAGRGVLEPADVVTE